MDARDRWLYGWGVGYAAVGGASLLVPLYALELGGGPALVGLLAAAAAFAGVPGALLWSRDSRSGPIVAGGLLATLVGYFGTFTAAAAAVLLGAALVLALGSDGDGV
jgi:hypothetical protein